MGYHKTAQKLRNDIKSPFYISAVYAPAISKDASAKATKQMHNEMESYRVRRENALDDSIKIAEQCRIR